MAKAAEIQSTEQRGTASAEERRENHAAKSEKPQKKSNKGKLIAIILAVVAVLAAAIYVFGFSGLINGKETTAPQTTAAPVTVPDFQHRATPNQTLKTERHGTSNLK